MKLSCEDERQIRPNSIRHQQGEPDIAVIGVIVTCLHPLLASISIFQKTSLAPF